MSVEMAGGANAPRKAERLIARKSAGSDPLPRASSFEKIAPLDTDHGLLRLIKLEKEKVGRGKDKYRSGVRYQVDLGRTALKTVKLHAPAQQLRGEISLSTARPPGRQSHTTNRDKAARSRAALCWNWHLSHGRRTDRSRYFMVFWSAYAALQEPRRSHQGRQRRPNVVRFAEDVLAEGYRVESVDHPPSGRGWRSLMKRPAHIQVHSGGGREDTIAFPDRTKATVHNGQRRPRADERRC